MGEEVNVKTSCLEQLKVKYVDTFHGRDYYLQFRILGSHARHIEIGEELYNKIVAKHRAD